MSNKELKIKNVSNSSKYTNKYTFQDWLNSASKEHYEAFAIIKSAVNL